MPICKQRFEQRTTPKNISRKIVFFIIRFVPHKGTGKSKAEWGHYSQLSTTSVEIFLPLFSEFACESKEPNVIICIQFD